MIVNQRREIFPYTWSFEPDYCIVGKDKIGGFQSRKGRGCENETKDTRRTQGICQPDSVPEAKGIAAVECTTDTRPRIAHLKASLEKQLTNLRQLDEEILRDLVGVEGVTDEEIAEEVRVAGD